MRSRRSELKLCGVVAHSIEMICRRLKNILCAQIYIHEGIYIYICYIYCKRCESFLLQNDNLAIIFPGGGAESGEKCSDMPGRISKSFQTYTIRVQFSFEKKCLIIVTFFSVSTPYQSQQTKIDFTK